MKTVAFLALIVSSCAALSLRADDPQFSGFYGNDGVAPLVTQDHVRFQGTTSTGGSAVTVEFGGTKTPATVNGQTWQADVTVTLPASGDATAYYVDASGTKLGQGTTLTNITAARLLIVACPQDYAQAKTSASLGPSLAVWSASVSPAHLNWTKAPASGLSFPQAVAAAVASRLASPIAVCVITTPELFLIPPSAPPEPTATGPAPPTASVLDSGIKSLGSDETVKLLKTLNSDHWPIVWLIGRHDAASAGWQAYFENPNASVGITRVVKLTEDLMAAVGTATAAWQKSVLPTKSGVLVAPAHVADPSIADRVAIECVQNAMAVGSGTAGTDGFVALIPTEKIKLPFVLEDSPATKNALAALAELIGPTVP